VLSYALASLSASFEENVGLRTVCAGDDLKPRSAVFPRPTLCRRETVFGDLDALTSPDGKNEAAPFGRRRTIWQPEELERLPRQLDAASENTNLACFRHYFSSSLLR
jgi:hypothetical protein